ncbi:Flagellin [gamma proteobacterium HdN1]|nr:Flagellin [gamma proteobacterium HdN1]
MRISNNQSFSQGVNSMLDQYSSVSYTQLQISEGTRILKPSDDPVGTSIALNLRQQVNAAEQYAKNSGSAASMLKSEEASLTSVNDILGRIRDLLVTAGNGILNYEDRKTIATEMQGRLDELVSVANTQSADGKYIFSGARTNTMPITRDAGGNYVYGGDQTNLTVQVNSSVVVKGTDNGSELFMEVPTGNGAFETRQNPLNNGSGVIGPASVYDVAQYLPDTYTVDVFVDGGGVTRYSISDSAGGQVVPAPPAVIATDSPEFVNGADIQFNGVRVAIAGQPVAGDKFTIQPSLKKSVFQTVADAIRDLQLANSSDAMLAHYKNNVGRALQNVDQAISHTDSFRSQLGTRVNVVESEADINENLVVQAKGALSLVEDLDYAEAITRMNRQSVALQAAQQSFVKIQSLNIFQFI